MVEQIFGNTALGARATNLGEEQDSFIYGF